MFNLPVKSPHISRAQKLIINLSSNLGGWCLQLFRITEKSTNKINSKTVHQKTIVHSSNDGSKSFCKRSDRFIIDYCSCVSVEWYS